MTALAPRQRRHWHRNLRLTGLLLALWFVISYVLAFFAREIDFAFFGWPFGFWVAAQGAPIVYGLMVWFYAVRMERLDREHAVAEPADD